MILRVFSIWAPPFIYVPIIFILSIKPIHESIFNNHDKLTHLGAYCLLGALFTRTLVSGIRINKITPTLALALAASILLGALTEAVQHFIPYRDASIFDMVANAVGAFIGVFIYIFITKTIKGKDLASS